MEQYLKERLIGAAVLIVLAALFIPMFLSDKPVMYEDSEESEPEQNSAVATPDYHSRIVPLKDESEATVSEAVAIDESAAETDTVAPLAEPEMESVDTSGEQVEAITETEIVPEQKQEQTKKIEIGSTQAWVVQLGSFSSEENAQTLNKRLLQHKFPSFVEPLVQTDKVVYRVRVGPALQKDKIEKLQLDIKNKLGVEGILVKYP